MNERAQEHQALYMARYYLTRLKPALRQMVLRDYEPAFLPRQSRAYHTSALRPCFHADESNRILMKVPFYFPVNSALDYPKLALQFPS